MNFNIKLYVYGIVNKITKMVIYIGITNNPQRRFKEHMNNKNDHSCAKGMQEEINEYGKENFEYVILYESYDEIAVQHAERNYIQMYRTMEDGIGYNRTNGGEYLPGFKYRDNSFFEKMKLNMRLYRNIHRLFKRWNFYKI